MTREETLKKMQEAIGTNVQTSLSKQDVVNQFKLAQKQSLPSKTKSELITEFKELGISKIKPTKTDVIKTDVQAPFIFDTPTTQQPQMFDTPIQQPTKPDIQEKFDTEKFVQGMFARFDKTNPFAFDKQALDYSFKEYEKLPKNVKENTSPFKMFFDSKDMIRDMEIERVEQDVLTTRSGQMGQTAGRVLEFGMTYMAGGQAVEKVMQPLTNKIAYTFAKKAVPTIGANPISWGKVTSALASEFSKDIVLGQPLHYQRGKELGLEGEELVKYMGSEAITDFVANFIFLGIGMGASKIKESASAKREFVESLHKQTTLPRQSIEEALEQAVNTEPKMKSISVLKRVDSIEGRLSKIKTKAELLEASKAKLKSGIIPKDTLTSLKSDYRTLKRTYTQTINNPQATKQQKRTIYNQVLSAKDEILKAENNLANTKNSIRSLDMKLNNLSSAEKSVQTQYKRVVERYKTDVLENLQKVSSKSNDFFPQYRDAIVELTNSIDTTAKRIKPNTVLNLEQTKAMLDDMSKDFIDGTKISKMQVEVPQDIIDSVNRLNKTKIGDMSLQEVVELDNTIRYISHQQAISNKIIGTEKFMYIDEVINDTVRRQPPKKPTALKEVEGGEVGKFFKNTFQTRALTGDSIFEEITMWDKNSNLFKLYDDVAKGVGVRDAIQMEGLDIYNRALRETGVQIDAPPKIYTDIPITVKGEKFPLELTAKDRITLYNTLNDPYGGRVLKEGGFSTNKMTVNNADPIKLTNEQISKIISDMPNEEITFAEKIGSDFYNSFAREKSNATSLILDGREIATNENYFGLISDKSFREQNFGNFVRNPNMERARIFQARTGKVAPIRLLPIDEHFKVTNEMMSKYAGLAVPTRNLKAVMGNVEMRKIIRDTYGEGGEAVIENMFKSLDGEFRKMTAFDKTYGKMLNSLTSVALASPTVPPKQLASFITAMADVDPQDFIGIKWRSRDFISKYSGMLKKRFQGLVTPEAGELLASKPRSIFTRGITSMDSRVMQGIWGTQENFIKRTTDIPVGSDEFYRAVAERTEYIVRRTQPNFEGFFRSDIGRTTNPVEKIATMFTSQTNQNYNVMYRGIKESLATGNPMPAARSITSVALASVVLATLDTAWDVYRGREPKYLERLVGYGISPFYFIPRLYSTLTQNFEYDNIVEDSINEMVKATQVLFDNDSNVTEIGKINQVAKALSRFVGIPYSVIERELKSAVRHIDKETYLRMEFVTKKPSNGTLYAEFKNELADKDFDENVIDFLIDKMNENGVTRSNFENSMKQSGLLKADYLHYLTRIKKK
jgi:hypothetical protein